jgi:glutamate-1-semialdehyde 2,1-aminomutase
MAQTSAQSAYEQLAADFVQRNPKSKAIFEAATEALPGANTRSVLFYSPFPLSMKSAEGARLIDVDGHVYTDFLGEYTAGLYGHSDKVIIKAIHDATTKGLNFGWVIRMPETMLLLTRRLCAL